MHVTSDTCRKLAVTSYTKVGGVHQQRVEERLTTDRQRVRFVRSRITKAAIALWKQSSSYLVLTQLCHVIQVIGVALTLVKQRITHVHKWNGVNNQEGQLFNSNLLELSFLYLRNVVQSGKEWHASPTVRNCSWFWSRIEEEPIRIVSPILQSSIRGLRDW